MIRDTMPFSCPCNTEPPPLGKRLDAFISVLSETTRGADFIPPLCRISIWIYMYSLGNRARDVGQIEFQPD